MFKMIRTFHPVGHGAFYTEEFVLDNVIKYTMVFDCGGTKIKDKIDSIFSEEYDIDLVYISHFHDDHVNGLEYLLERCKVKKIILPLLHDEEKIEVFLENENSSFFVQNLCLNPKAIIKEYSKYKKIEVIFVSTEVDDNNTSTDISNIEGEVKSGTKITIKLLSGWIYVPFNFKYKIRNKILLDKLKSEGISLELKTFKQTFNKNKKLIKDIIYKSIGKKGEDKHINTNSLVIYSGISNDKRIFKRSLFKIDTYKRYRKEVGCLYMGDYNAKKNFEDSKNKFKKYFKKISVIQVPHHGSIHNYHKGLNFKKNLISIISAPEKSKDHPHVSVINMITLKYGLPLIVTDEPLTKVVQTIEAKEGFSPIFRKT